jgi:hypothetical protein
MQKIAPAFIKAKKAFQPALKDKTNPAFRSKYADLGACLEAVEDALLDNGIALYQETSPDDTGVTVETILLHESGESIRSGKLHVPAAKQDPQGYGSALTYARRYSLMAACGIAPEDDDGNAASSRQAAPAPQAKPATKAAPKPAEKPRMLTNDEIEDVELAMVECADIEQLKAVFASAYPKCSPTQQVHLKKAYDEIKANLTNKEHA